MGKLISSILKNLALQKNIWKSEQKSYTKSSFSFSYLAMTSTAKMKLGIGALLLAIIGIVFASLYPFDEVQAPANPLQETTPLTEPETEPSIDPEIKNETFVPSCDENSGEQCAVNEFPKEISREEAKNLILEGKVKSLFQAHSLQVQLTTDEGSFTTQEPVIDEVFKVWKECGEACKGIPLATE